VRKTVSADPPPALPFKSRRKHVAVIPAEKLRQPRRKPSPTPPVGDEDPLRRAVKVARELRDGTGGWVRGLTDEDIEQHTRR
jgi:hypothetical protein